MDLYWVGGSDDWDNVAGSKWASSSGGTGGEAVPTASDNVFFDSNSGAVTVNVAADVFCLNLDCTGFTGTLTATSPDTWQLFIYGTLRYVAEMTLSLAVTTFMESTTTGNFIITGGKILTGDLYLEGDGGEWHLDDDLTIDSLHKLFFDTQGGTGTFDANDKNITVGGVELRGGTDMECLMGTGTWTLTGSNAGVGTIWTSETITDNLTLNFESSTIVVNDSSAATKQLNFDDNGNEDTVEINILTIDPAVGAECSLNISGVTDINVFNCVNLADRIDLNFSGSQLHTFSPDGFNVAGSIGKVLYIVGGGIGDETTFSMASGVVACDYLNISDTIATGGADWYAGSNSVDNTNNTGWIFDDPPVEGHETADVSPVEMLLTVAAVTATYAAILTAAVDPVVLTFSVPSVTSPQVFTASVSPVVTTLSVPNVTADYSIPQLETASVVPVVLTISKPSVTGSYVNTVTASVAPVVLSLSIPEMTANQRTDESITLPVAVPLYKPKFTFIVESRNPHFRYATENWEFTEITREINGSMMVKIKTDQLTTDIANAITDVMNRVTIRISTPNTGSQGLQYFCGYIPNRSLNLQADNQSVDITAFGFASRLFDIPYRDGTTVAIDKTGGAALKASELAADVVDKVIALDAFWPVNYTADSIEDSVDDIQDKFVLMKAAEVINKATVLAYDSSRIWHWVILGDNIFRFKKDSATADHQFVYGRDVLSFPTFTEDLQQARNEVLVVYNGGANIKRVADSASITQYGLRGDTVNETNIPDAPTAEELGNAYLASRVPPLRVISVTVGSNYPGGIENINPGDTCRIDNLPTDINALVTTNMFITRTVYRRHSVDLELSLKSPFIQNQVEIIRRRLEKESVENSSATDYS